jgi:hypothetical protein
MSTLVLETPPPELRALLERRRVAGVDRLDEVWEGLHRPGASGVWHATAAAVVEILSPGDESRQKLPFYAAHDVDEVLLVDPATRTVTWLALQAGEYAPVQRSGLIDLGPTELAELVDWP